MRMSNIKVSNRSIEHWLLRVVFVGYPLVKIGHYFSYINYSFYFENCQVKFLFFLKKFLIIK